VSSEAPETRKRILKATLELLESAPKKSVRMSDIAKRAGISRQALYLHFSTRAELLIATTFYLDDITGAEEKLVPSRTAKSGIERLDAFIEAWGAYLPEVYGLAKALLSMKDTDEAAAEAWNQRMQDMKEGCEAAILALQTDGTLSPEYSKEDATDILWTMLSVRNWEQLTVECGWPHEKYVTTLKALVKSTFVIT